MVVSTTFCNDILYFLPESFFIFLISEGIPHLGTTVWRPKKDEKSRPNDRLSQSMERGRVGHERERERDSESLFVISYPVQAVVLPSQECLDVILNGITSSSSCPAPLPLCVEKVCVSHTDMDTSGRSRIILCVAISLAQVFSVTTQNVKLGE